MHIYKEAAVCVASFSPTLFFTFSVTSTVLSTATDYIIKMSSSTFKCKHCALTFLSINSRHYHQYTQCISNPKVQAKKAKAIHTTTSKLFIIYSYKVLKNGFSHLLQKQMKCQLLLVLKLWQMNKWQLVSYLKLIYARCEK